MNKVLVKLYVPLIEAEYDLWIPINKKIYKVRDALNKLVKELYGGNYFPPENSNLYEKETGRPYDINSIVKDCNIINGTEIILI